jgi:hypothetical protein
LVRSHDQCGEISGDKFTQHGNPGLRRTIAVVASTAKGHQLPLRETIRNAPEALCSMRVQRRSVFQVSGRIVPRPVGATLKENEFGLEAIKMPIHSRPGFQKLGVAGPRFQRDLSSALSAPCPPRSFIIHRSAADGLELACTIPASVKVGGVFFMAMRTKRRAAWGLGPLDLMDELARLRRFALIHDPYFRPCMVKRNFAHDALCILVEHPGVDARLRKQTPHKMRIRKRRR